MAGCVSATPVAEDDALPITLSISKQKTSLTEEDEARIQWAKDDKDKRILPSRKDSTEEGRNEAHASILSCSKRKFEPKAQNEDASKDIKETTPSKRKVRHNKICRLFEEIISYSQIMYLYSW